MYLCSTTNKHLYPMTRIIAIICALTMTLTSCKASAGSANAAADRITRTATVSGTYKKVSVENGIIVNYTATPGAKTTTAEISGTSEAVGRVIIEISDNELEIRMTNRRSGSSSPAPIVHLSGLPVAEFETSSAAIININSSIKTSGKFEAEVGSGSIININRDITARDLDIDLSSGAVINTSGKLTASQSCKIDASSGSATTIGTVTCDHIDVDASSGAVISVGGSAKTADVDASSGAILNLDKLQIKQYCNVDASSGAIINVAARDKIRGDKSSGAIINYK